MNSKLEKLFSKENLRFIGIFVGSLLILFYLFNLLIMPVYTRQYQSIKVPNVTNMSYSAAEKIIKKKGLKVVKAGEKYDANYPPGFVLFQNPEGESPVKKGRRIYLTVGKGQKVIEMPKLVGLSQRDALFVLNENNLKLGSVKYEIDNYYPENVVSQQSIPENNQVISGESIDLTVSLGIEPTEFIVPNLVGKSLNDAKIAIKKAGLTLGDIEYQQTEKVLPNTVLDQSLEPKLEVSKHDTIGLVISKLLISEEDKVVW